jgi:peptidoglycan/xylan/chitin deacetylase (PgdA/CDA1 family)
VIPGTVERRARWVLDSIGASEIGFGDDVPYVESAWEQVEQGIRPDDPVALAFFELARLEERDGTRDAHGRFPARAYGGDLLKPAAETLRERLGVPPPRPLGAQFAVALTHDVDVVWRWTRLGVKGALWRARRGDLRQLGELARAPLHRVRGTDPWWRFRELLEAERRLGARSTFFVLATNRVPEDGLAPDVYERLRPRLVEELRAGGAEIGLHPSYRAADEAALLEEERASLESLAGPLHGVRYHYLRLDPHRNLAPLASRFDYDSTLGFPDGLGFRGSARPFRPWNSGRDEAFDLLEIPMAAMDATLAESHYLGLTPEAASRRLDALLDRAAELGAAFSVIWHTERFDPATARGWDRLYFRLIEGVKARGGVCVDGKTLAGATPAGGP